MGEALFGVVLSVGHLGHGCDEHEEIGFLGTLESLDAQVPGRDTPVSTLTLVLPAVQ